MAKIGKRIRNGREGIDRTKLYGLDEAVQMLKGNGQARSSTRPIEVAMNLGVDPRHADQMVRGVVNLPNGTGCTVRVAVFARGDKAEEAKAAGADIVGAEDLVEQVQGGTIDFDRRHRDADMMALVGRLGKVLGPRGLMPNPRVGTVTPDVAAAVKASKGGAVEFRVEKAGIVHAGVGPASFETSAITENIRAFADAVQQGQALGRQGQLRPARGDHLDHGPGREDRPVDAGDACLTLINGGRRTYMRRSPIKRFRARPGAWKPDDGFLNALSEIVGRPADSSGHNSSDEPCMRRGRVPRFPGRQARLLSGSKL